MSLPRLPIPPQGHWALITRPDDTDAALVVNQMVGRAARFNSICANCGARTRYDPCNKTTRLRTNQVARQRSVGGGDGGIFASGVVTGHDGEGKAVVVSDVDAATIQIGESRFGGAAHQSLADGLRRRAPPSTGRKRRWSSSSRCTRPKAGRSSVSSSSHRRTPELLKTIDGKAAFASIGASRREWSRARCHPFMHRAETIDYAVVISALDHHAARRHSRSELAAERHADPARSPTTPGRTVEPSPNRIAFILVDAER